jgi:hypothetical protein
MVSGPALWLHLSYTASLAPVVEWNLFPTSYINNTMIKIVGRDLMQCKDIPNEPILEFIAQHGGIGCTWVGTLERSVRHAMPAGIPNQLVLAKMRVLLRNDLVAGCGCGCRGDFELTEKGQQALSRVE